ncbi:hypothetical protein NMY22_g2214 [Coprinellus aureogranulatus]|nr:hypothetical protein NMY22_g2214 [Coprinellus aureogranulatus]
MFVTVTRLEPSPYPIQKMNENSGTPEDQLLNESTVSNCFSPETTILVNGGSGRLDHKPHSKKLADRLYILEHEVAALKTCQNATAPINRLPPEILSHIFLDVQKQEDSVETVCWVAVTHVCNHWRNVALKCTALWSHLAFPHPDFTELMLSRSASAPLHVEVNEDVFDPWFEDVLQKALSQVERIHTVDLVLPEGRGLEGILPPSLSGAPVLEHLVLRGYYFDLPSTFFDGGVPRLRELGLDGCNFSVNTIPFSATMTRLMLGSQREGDRPSVQAFSNALKQMPFLDSLHLDCYLPPNLASPSSQPTPHRLKHDKLRFLRLEDTSEALLGFFELVQVPNAQKITLAFLNAESRESLTSLIRRLRSSWNGGGRLNVCKISPFSPVGVSVSFHGSGFVKELTLSAPYFPSLIAPLYHLLIMTHELDFDDLQAVSISHQATAVTPEELVSVFGRYRNLQEVNLEDGFPIAHLLHLLRSTNDGFADSSTARDHSHPLTVPFNFPGLLTITCTDLSLGYGEERRGNIIAIAQTLRERAKHSKLKKLLIRSCPSFTVREHCLLSEPPIPGLEVVLDGKDVIFLLGAATFRPESASTVARSEKRGNIQSTFFNASSIHETVSCMGIRYARIERIIFRRIHGCASFRPWSCRTLQGSGNVEEDWDSFHEGDGEDDYDDDDDEDLGDEDKYDDDLGDEDEYDEDGDEKEEEDDGDGMVERGAAHRDGRTDAGVN